MSYREEGPKPRILSTLDEKSEVTKDIENLENRAPTFPTQEAHTQTMESPLDSFHISLDKKYIALPEFDPDKPDITARSWCNIADICIKETSIQGGELIITLCKSMKGNASRWLTEVSYPGMTWPEFRSRFLSRYDFRDTPAGTLIKLLNEKPSERESYADYASRLTSTLYSHWENKSVEEIAVATVLAHMAHFDDRIHKLAYVSEVKNKSELQRELQSISKRKIVIKCYTCGRFGHLASKCRWMASAFVPKQRSDIICYRCGYRGHYASNCRRSNRGGNGAATGSERVPAEVKPNKRQCSPSSVDPDRAFFEQWDLLREAGASQPSSSGAPIPEPFDLSDQASRERHLSRQPTTYIDLTLDSDEEAGPSSLAREDTTPKRPIETKRKAADRATEVKRLRTLQPSTASLPLPNNPSSINQHNQRPGGTVSGLVDGRPLYSRPTSTVTSQTPAAPRPPPQQ